MVFILKTINRILIRLLHTSLKVNLLFFVIFLTTFTFAQNVGIGTTTPTHSFHVVRSPGNPNLDPLRVEGLRNSTSDTSFLVVDNLGVVKYFTLNQLRSGVLSNLDSIVVANMIQNADTLFSSASFSDSLKSYIYNNSDTLFANRAWLDSLTHLIKDSIRSQVDSLAIGSSDSLHLYQNGNRVSLYLQDLDSSNELIDTIYIQGDSLVIKEQNQTHFLSLGAVIDSYETVLLF